MFDQVNSFVHLLAITYCTHSVLIHQPDKHSNAPAITILSPTRHYSFTPNLKSVSKISHPLALLSNKYAPRISLNLFSGRIRCVPLLCFANRFAVIYQMLFVRQLTIYACEVTVTMRILLEPCFLSMPHGLFHPACPNISLGVMVGNVLA